MGVSISNITRSKNFNRRQHAATITFDEDYTSGGEVISPADLGLAHIESVQLTSSTDGFVPAWDQTNSSVILFQGDYAESADGPLVEVGPSDVDGVAIYIQAVGH